TGVQTCALPILSGRCDYRNYWRTILGLLTYPNESKGGTVMRSTHTFQAENIVSGYDHKTVIQDVSLVIPSHKISVMIGANACGKSTLLKTLARLIKPTSGKVHLDGK